MCNTPRSFEEAINDTINQWLSGNDGMAMYNYWQSATEQALRTNDLHEPDATRELGERMESEIRYEIGGKVQNWLEAELLKLETVEVKGDVLVMTFLGLAKPMSGLYYALMSSAFDWVDWYARARALVEDMVAEWKYSGAYYTIMQELELDPEDVVQ